ncbi:MAG: DUF302 domain-containing protein [Gammaproteobacteria bacterium]|nr:DUF302 domain-containing protein [Gammaproteobacteria bacterium]
MKILITTLLLFLLGINIAHAGGIYKQSTNMNYDLAYKKVYESLEGSRFFVVEEINIGQNLSRFSDKWDDYNLSKLEDFRVMIICNGWYTNQVSNADTDMLALCPMRVTLIHKQGVTTVLFARPSTFANNSKALPILREAEETIIKAISHALK